MKAQKARWTKEEIAIITSERTCKQMAALLRGRTIAAIETKRKELKQARILQEERDDAYDGRPVRPYQFISTREATPARKKVWDKEERALQTI